MNRIENPTDQIKGFSEEIAGAVKEIVSRGYTVDQAIKIVEIGAYNIRTEVMKHDIAESVKGVSEAISEVAEAKQIGAERITEVVEELNIEKAMVEMAQWFYKNN